MRMPFESEGARTLNRDIFETMYFAAMTASCELAEKEGPYETFEGSPVSEGIFQFDMWGEVRPARVLVFDSLRKCGFLFWCVHHSFSSRCRDCLRCRCFWCRFCFRFWSGKAAPGGAMASRSLKARALPVLPTAVFMMHGHCPLRVFPYNPVYEALFLLQRDKRGGRGVLVASLCARRLGGILVGLQFVDAAGVLHLKVLNVNPGGHHQYPQSLTNASASPPPRRDVVVSCS